MKKKTLFMLFCFGLMLTLAGGVAYAQSITVTAPASGATWCKGQAYNITWTKSGDMAAEVKIRLYDTALSTVILPIVDSAPNSGSFSWSVPNSLAPGSYRIRVRTVDNAVYGDGAVFTIAECVPDGSITVTAPGSGASWCKNQVYNIVWNKTGSMDANVKIRLYDVTASTVIHPIVDSTPNSGTYSWNIPGSIPDGNYIIRVRTTDNAVMDDSVVFEIKACGSGGPGPDWDRIKEILRGLKEIEYWRIRPPRWPWPSPCLSCPPEFDLGRIRDLFEKVGFKERVKVELFGQDGKLSDLGVFGKGVSFGKSFRMSKIGKVHSEKLQAGQGFKLVIKNMAGDIIHTVPVNMKEIQGAMR